MSELPDPDYSSWPEASTLVKVFLHEGVPPFRQMTEGAAGFDLAAKIPTSIVLEPFNPVVVPSGVHVAMPIGMEATVRPRSGLGKKGILAMFGTVDADYRGEIGVTLINLTLKEYEIRPGDRIAQLVFSKFASVTCELVEDQDALGKTARGTAGFGSTGR